jgi:hypothetical protein
MVECWMIVEKWLKWYVKYLDNASLSLSGLKMKTYHIFQLWDSNRSTTASYATQSIKWEKEKCFMLFIDFYNTVIKLVSPAWFRLQY